MEDNQPLIILIASSPLNGAQKQHLRTVLDAQGQHQDFYQLFNTYLLEDLKERQTLYPLLRYPLIASPPSLESYSCDPIEDTHRCINLLPESLNTFL